MKTITIQARIEHGRIVTELPHDVDGVYTVTVQLDDTSPSEQRASPTSLVDALQPITLPGWSADSRFGRDEIYDEDGR
jgi:hypothetical protein